MRVLRTYARSYTANLDDAVETLTKVTGEKVGVRFSMPNGLELASVGRVLVVAGDDDTLAPFRETQATLIVDDLDECQALLAESGATVIRGPQTVPTGRNLTARLPGGLQLEFVEWSDAQWGRADGPAR